MSTEYACSSCNSCTGCNVCQKCNTGCQVTCNTSQALCKINGQSYSANAGAFSWEKCVTKGQIIGPGYFDQDEWDRIISHINKARNAGREVSTGGTISKSTKADVSPFSAEEFNRVARKVEGTTVSANNVIYGKYFEELKTAANTMKISSSACDSCNTKCNGGCNECQKCNGGCNSCNGSSQASYYPYCCGCDGHESDRQN